MNIIEVNNLVKEYKGRKVNAIDDITFSVSKGEFFALLGPNGSGKTTTISILTTTLSKTSGKITIAGYDIDKESRLIREKIGFISQKTSLDTQFTAAENIRFHACLYSVCSYRPSFTLMSEAYRKKVLELARIFGIEDTLFKPIKKLSRGIQRKLEIIRSLIHTPEILFLDEPNQGLDAVSRRDLWNYINMIREKYGTTIFLTTHYIDEAEQANRVCVINQGKIVSCCPPEQMKEDLIQQELIIDAEDRTSLAEELIILGVNFGLYDNHLRVTYNGCMQDIVANIDTKLSILKIYEPSLEDAYVKLLKQTDGLNCVRLNAY